MTWSTGSWTSCGGSRTRWQPSGTGPGRGTPPPWSTPAALEHPAREHPDGAGEYGPGDGWAEGYADFRRPASAVRDDDGAGDR